MSELTKAVHERPEEYKRGWVHGFYDATSDDGAFYGDLSEDHGICSAGLADTVRLYQEGYRNGRQVRLHRNLETSQ